MRGQEILESKEIHIGLEMILPGKWLLCLCMCGFFVLLIKYQERFSHDSRKMCSTCVHNALHSQPPLPRCPDFQKSLDYKSNDDRDHTIIIFWEWEVTQWSRWVYPSYKTDNSVCLPSHSSEHKINRWKLFVDFCLIDNPIELHTKFITSTLVIWG